MRYEHGAVRVVPDAHDCAGQLATLLGTCSRDRAAEIAALVLELQHVRDQRGRVLLTRRLRLVLAAPDRAPAAVVALPAPASTDPAPIPGARLGALTAREREVLVLMATGATNREIAGELSITEGTVKQHVKHVLRKVGVRTRAAAVAVHLTRA